MSKEKSKGMDGFTQQKSFFFPEILEKEARDNLASGKFRQAKDDFKELCKHDKEKYLPGLLECYQGMANQMIQNGQLSDAVQIVDNIKALTGDRSEGALDILISIKKKDYDSVARIYTNLLSQGKDSAAIPGSSLVADALVVAFREFPLLKSAHHEIYEELCAAQQALEDICAERYDDAWLKAKKIGVHSIFSNWKLLIKGLVAFYKYEDQKTLEALGRLSSDTPLHGIAQPYLALLGSKTVDQKALNESCVQRMCVVAGYPDIVSVMPKADSLWHAGRYSDSYRHIRNNMKSFPSESADITGILTRFYFNSIYHLPFTEALRYLEQIRDNDMPASPERGLEELLLCRAECLLFEKECTDEGDDKDCAGGWQHFLEIYTNVFGDNNKLASLVYFHLGSMFAAETPREPDLFSWMSTGEDRGRLRNENLAGRYFSKSIDADKDNKDAYLGLLKVYEKTNNRSKVNKLLDKLIPLFPDDVAILTQAGVSCVDRKSYNKGMKYLEKAARLDPLDSFIKERLAHLYLAAARACFDKGQVKEGRALYEKALTNGTLKPRDFNRGCAYIYARWAVLEFKNKNEDAADEKLRLAREKTGELLPLLYFTYLISRQYDMPADYIRKLGKEVEQEWRLPPTPVNALALLMVYDYIRMFGADWLKSEMKMVLQYALDASDKPCSGEEAAGIISFALSDKQAQKLGDVYIKKMLLADRDDPLFNSLAYQLKLKNSNCLPGRRDLDEFQRILHLAEKRNNVELARDLRKKIKALEEMLEVRDMLSGGGPFDGGGMDMDANMEVLEKLFEEIHRKEGGQRRKR